MEHGDTPSKQKSKVKKKKNIFHRDYDNVKED